MRWLSAGLLAVFSSISLHASEVSLADDRGIALDIELPAERIVSLAPHLTEQLFAIGAGDRLVGTSEYSDWPPAAEEIPRIGNAFRFDLERIIAMQPDVVLAWKTGTPAGVIEQIERLGLPVAVIASPDVAAVTDNLRWMGKLVGEEESANAVAQGFLHEMEAIEAAYSGKRKLDVFYQISAQPLFTVNGRHSISSVIRMCGGRNIFEQLDGVVAPVVSREAVVARNPDVIIGGKAAIDASDWQEWPKLDAVRHGNVMTVNATLLARPTPRLAEGARNVCQALDNARRNLEPAL